MKPLQVKFQIGKNGITDGVISSLELALKNHRHVRISVLKSATRDRKELKKMAETIKEKIPSNCETKLIGYTIILMRKNVFIKKPKKKAKTIPKKIITRTISVPQDFSSWRQNK